MMNKGVDYHAHKIMIKIATIYIRKKGLYIKKKLIILLVSEQ